MSLHVDQDAYARDGYLVVRSVLTPAEVEQLRQDSHAQFAEDLAAGLADNSIAGLKLTKGDLLSKRHLNRLVFDPRIVEIAARLLECGTPVYFGDSSYQLGTGLRGYHRDNVDRTDLAGPDWEGQYGLLRVGIYLQDSKRHSGGLKVKLGSHRSADGRPALVDNEVGDVVVWNLRTLHSGNAVRLRIPGGFPWLWPTTRLMGLLPGEPSMPSWLCMPPEKERIACFITYGRETPHLHRYIQEYILKRADASAQIGAAPCSQETWDAASRALALLRVVPGFGVPD